MAFYLILLFIFVPIVELTILIRIGEATVWWVPIAIVIFAGVTGTLLARWQGLRTYQRIRDDARAGQMPSDALMDGFLILLAAVLLIIPGVLTDIVGIALLIPPVRTLVKRGTKAWARRHVKVRVGGMPAGFWSGSGQAPQMGNDEIIDARVIGTHVEDVKP